MSWASAGSSTRRPSRAAQGAGRRCSTRPTAVLVDLSDCEFIDSTGLGLLVEAKRRLSEDRRRFGVCCPDEDVRRLLELTGIDEAVGLFNSRDEALAGAAATGFLTTRPPVAAEVVAAGDLADVIASRSPPRSAPAPRLARFPFTLWVPTLTLGIPRTAVSSFHSACRLIREICICETPSRLPDLVLRQLVDEPHLQHPPLALVEPAPRPRRAATRSGHTRTRRRRSPRPPASPARRRPARCVERQGPSGVPGLDRLEHIFGRDAEAVGDLGRRSDSARAPRSGPVRVVDPHRQLLKAARQADLPDVVAEVAAQLAEDRRDRVGGERPARARGRTRRSP